MKFCEVGEPPPITPRHEIPSEALREGGFHSASFSLTSHQRRSYVGVRGLSLEDKFTETHAAFKWMWQEVHGQFLKVLQ